MEWCPTGRSRGTSSSISDIDADTKIEVEQAADEDIMRFTVSATEAMTINPTGVGIGTTSPLVPLHVAREGGNNASIGIMTAGSGTSELAILGFPGTLASPSANSSGSVIGKIIFNGHDGSNFRKASEISSYTTENWSGTGTGAGISFKTTPNGTTAIAEAMRIHHDGNIGIGITAPSFQVHQASSAQAFNVVQTSSSSGYSVVGVGRTEGSVGSETAPGLNSILGEFMFLGYDGGGFQESAVVQAKSSEAHGAGATGADLVLKTTPNGSTTALDRMVILNGGNVGINTNTPNSLLEVKGPSQGLFGQLAIAGDATGNTNQSFLSFTRSDGSRAGYLGEGSSGDANISLGAELGNLSLSAASGDVVIAAGNLGVGTSTPQNALDVEGGAVIGASYSGTNTAPTNGLLVQGNIGIGTTTPNAPLQFSQAFPSRKIVLYEGGNNDHQYYGFGMSASQLEYHTDQSNADHVFYSAINTTSSLELMRIEGGGNVGIGTTTPSQKLEVGGNLKLTNAADEVYRGTEISDHLPKGYAVVSNSGTIMSAASTSNIQVDSHNAGSGVYVLNYSGAGTFSGVGECMVQLTVVDDVGSGSNPYFIMYQITGAKQITVYTFDQGG